MQSSEFERLLCQQCFKHHSAAACNCSDMSIGAARYDATSGCITAVYKDVVLFAVASIPVSWLPCDIYVCKKHAFVHCCHPECCTMGRADSKGVVLCVLSGLQLNGATMFDARVATYSTPASATRPVESTVATSQPHRSLSNVYTSSMFTFAAADTDDTIASPTRLKLKTVWNVAREWLTVRLVEILLYYVSIDTQATRDKHAVKSLKAIRRPVHGADPCALAGACAYIEPLVLLPPDGVKGVAAELTPDFLTLCKDAVCKQGNEKQAQLYEIDYMVVGFLFTRREDVKDTVSGLVVCPRHPYLAARMHKLQVDLLASHSRAGVAVYHSLFSKLLATRPASLWIDR